MCRGYDEGSDGRPLWPPRRFATAARSRKVKRAFVGVFVLGLVLALGRVAFAAEDEAKELKGDAGCMMCCFKGAACGPAVKIGETVYALQASDKASDETKALIKSFKGAKECTAVVIKGVVSEKTIVADEVTKAPKEEK
jgi:hypothetical protein